MKLNKAFMLTLLCISAGLLGQQRLTLAEAMATALENNYDIRIAKNNEASSEVSNDWALFTTLIPISLSYGGSATVVNSSQENFINQTSFGISETKDTFFGGNLGVNLSINDIYQAIKSYEKSDVDYESQKHGTVNQIQSLMKNVMNSYFTLAKQQNLLKVREEAVKTSELQVKRAESRFQIGTAAKKDVMSQKVQLNNDRSSLLSQKLQVQTAQNQLNIALGRNPFDAISVDESVTLNGGFNNYDDLEGDMLANNPDLESTKTSLKSAEISLDQANYSLYIPSFGVSARYNRNVSNDKDLGNMIDRLTDFETNFSSSIGLNISYSLNANKVVQSQQAEIARQNADLRLEQKKSELKATLYQAFVTYKNAVEQVTLLKENVEASRENLKLAQERFNLGTGTSIDLRQAQDGLTNAETSLVNSRYDAKLAEVEIERLLGKIETN